MSSNLLDLLPEQVRYERRELADEENALGSWLEAGAAIVERERTTELCCDVHLHGSCECDNCEETPFPVGEQRAELDGLLARNASALRLVDKGLMCRRLQLPRLKWPAFVQEGDPVAETWRSLVRMRYARAVLMLRDGKPEEAWREAIAVHRMGMMICGGEGLVLQYMLGTAYRKWGLNLMQDVAAKSAVGASIRQALADEIDRAWRSEDGLATSLRVEACCYAVPAVEAVPADRGLEALIDALVEQYYSNEPTLNSVFDESDPEHVPAEIVAVRRATRRRQLLILLEGHPLPFDTEATVQRLGQIYLGHLAQVEAGHPVAQGRWERLVAQLANWTGWGQQSPVERAWPASLRPEACIDWFGDDGLAKAARDQISSYGSMPRWCIRSLAPISDQRVRGYAGRLRRIENPVGELIAASLATCHPKPTWDYREKLATMRRELGSRVAA